MCLSALTPSYPKAFNATRVATYKIWFQIFQPTFYILSSMASIHLYAELLNNIRAVTLVASLETEQNEETRIELSQDGQIIHVTHEGETASLSLPTRMIGGGTAAITLPPIPSKDITLRLQLEEKEPGLLMLHNNSENVLPWSSETVNNNIACLHCGNYLLKPSSIKEWKDLPREDWAEMMEFWHCHKPHEQEQESQESKMEGQHDYVAHERIFAQSGVGLVGPTHFILSSEDCMNIMVSLSYSTFPTSYVFNITIHGVTRGRFYLLSSIIMVRSPILSPKIKFNETFVLLTHYRKVECGYLTNVSIMSRSFSVLVPLF